MNTVANSVGVRQGQPEGLLGRLVRGYALRANGPLYSMGHVERQRRVMKIAPPPRGAARRHTASSSVRASCTASSASTTATARRPHSSRRRCSPVRSRAQSWGATRFSRIARPFRGTVEAHGRRGHRARRVADAELPRRRGRDHRPHRPELQTVPPLRRAARVFPCPRHPRVAHLVRSARGGGGGGGGPLGYGGANPPRRPDASRQGARRADQSHDGAQQRWRGALHDRRRFTRAPRSSDGRNRTARTLARRPLKA